MLKCIPLAGASLNYSGGFILVQRGQSCIPGINDLDQGKEAAVLSPFLLALAQALGIVWFPVSKRKDQDPLSIRLQRYCFLFSVPPVFVRVGGFTLAFFLSSLSTPGLSHIIV